MEVASGARVAHIRITFALHRVVRPERTRQGYGRLAFSDNRYHPRP